MSVSTLSQTNPITITKFYGVRIRYNGYYNAAIAWFANLGDAKEFKTNLPKKPAVRSKMSEPKPCRVANSGHAIG